MTKQNTILLNEKKAYQKQLAESYRNMEGLKEEFLKCQAELQRQATLIDTLSTTKYGRVRKESEMPRCCQILLISLTHSTDRYENGGQSVYAMEIKDSGTAI